MRSCCRTHGAVPPISVAVCLSCALPGMCRSMALCLRTALFCARRLMALVSRCASLIWRVCRFMPPVDPAQSLCSVADAGACMAVYSEVRASVEAGIQELLAEREVDPERDLLPRLAGQASRFLPAFELASGR